MVDDDGDEHDVEKPRGGPRAAALPVGKVQIILRGLSIDLIESIARYRARPVGVDDHVALGCVVEFTQSGPFCRSDRRSPTSGWRSHERRSESWTHSMNICPSATPNSRMIVSQSWYYRRTCLDQMSR